jgi:hypothetical protein
MNIHIMSAVWKSCPICALANSMARASSARFMASPSRPEDTVPPCRKASDMAGCRRRRGGPGWGGGRT